MCRTPHCGFDHVSDKPHFSQLPALVEISDRLCKGVLADPIKSLLLFIEAGVGETGIEGSGFLLSTGFAQEQRLPAFELVAGIINRMIQQIPKHARKRAQALLCNSDAVAEFPRRVNSATLSSSERNTLNGVYEALVRYTNGKLNQPRQCRKPGELEVVDLHELEPESFGNEFVQSILAKVMANNKMLGSSAPDVFRTDVNIIKDDVRFQPGIGMAAAFRQKQLKETIHSTLSPVRLGRMLSPTTSIKQEFLDLQADQKEKNSSLKKLKPLKNPRVEARARQVAAGFQRPAASRQGHRGHSSPYAEDLTQAMRSKHKRATRQELVRRYMSTMTESAPDSPLVSLVAVASEAQPRSMLTPQSHIYVAAAANESSSASSLERTHILPTESGTTLSKQTFVDEYMELYNLKLREYEAEIREIVPARVTDASNPDDSSASRMFELPRASSQMPSNCVEQRHASPCPVSREPKFEFKYSNSTANTSHDRSSATKKVDCALFARIVQLLGNVVHCAAVRAAVADKSAPVGSTD